jgi:hypothetical protein
LFKFLKKISFFSKNKQKNLYGAAGGGGGAGGVSLDYI